jgi:hypothetical protein
LFVGVGAGNGRGGYGGYSICHDILTGGSNFHTMSESFCIIDFKR